MTPQKMDEDFYRVWFEYLIRTPLFRRLYDWNERIYDGEQIPFPAELDAFSRGYSRWFKYDRPWEVTFDRCYSRLKHREGVLKEVAALAFTPAQEIAWHSRQELQSEREDLGRGLTWQEEQAIIEKTAEAVLSDREKREKKFQSEFAAYRYKAKPPGFNKGPSLLATLKRRLNYYYLEEICNFTRSEIIFNDNLELGPAPLDFYLPFGPGPFTDKPREIDYFRYWKQGNGAQRDPRHFLSEEITEARKVIAAVEDGWFPAIPSSFNNSAG
jgi:hypothetical protein